MLIWLCGELIQLTGWTEGTKEQSEYFFCYFNNLKVSQEVKSQAQAEEEGQDQMPAHQKEQERAALSCLAGVSCVWDWLRQLI